MTKEQWKSILETINDNDPSYDVPDDETEFWEEADKADNALNDLKNLVEEKIEEAEEEIWNFWKANESVAKCWKCEVIMGWHITFEQGSSTLCQPHVKHFSKKPAEIRFSTSKQPESNQFPKTTANSPKTAFERNKEDWKDLKIP